MNRPEIAFSSQPPPKNLVCRPCKWRTHSSIRPSIPRFKAITVVGFLCAAAAAPNASVMKSPSPKLTPNSGRLPVLPLLTDEMGSILSPFRAGVVKAPKVGEFGSGGDGIGCAFWTSLSRRALSLVLGGGPVRFMQEVVLISAREFDLIRPCLV